MYYGYKLRPDATLLYEITRGRGQRLGRLYHMAPPPGINAPISFQFEPYTELGCLELFKDLPKVFKYQVEWLVFVRLWTFVSSRVRTFYWRKPF